MKRTVTANGQRLSYTLIRSKRSSLLMKALPGGEFRVWVPTYAHLTDIDRKVIEHMDELYRMSDQLENALARNRLKHSVEEGSSICIEGKVYRLTYGGLDEKIGIKFEDGLAIISGDGVEGDDEFVRALLKKELVKLAMKRIAERLAVYTPQIGVKYGRVTIRDQKTRWGSCSAKHNLNFNWKLIMAPPEVLDYVVIHELCHIIEFNHSKRFWGLVGSYMPEYEYWKKWLKDHGTELGVGE